MTTPKSKFHIPSLDGIRTVAVMIVFLSHAGLTFIPGGFGVTIFFFLSGYLITTMLRREHDRDNRIDFKKFYMRRVLRIWPAFYLVLFMAVAVSFALGFYADFSWMYLEGFLTQCFHVSNYHNIQYGNLYTALGTEVYWSLAVEEHFYLVFPLLYVILRRFKLNESQQASVFLGICLLVMILRCLLVFGAWGVIDRIYERTFFATDTRLDSILFGCVLAVVCNPAIERDWQIPDGLLKYVLFPLGLVLLLVTLGIRNDDFRNSVRYTIQGIALFPIFTAAIRYSDWGFFKILNWNWMRFMGVLSYSFYLIHFVVIKALQTAAPGLGMYSTGVWSLFISVVLSYAVYLYVEIPAAKLKKRFSTH